MKRRSRLAKVFIILTVVAAVGTFFLQFSSGKVSRPTAERGVLDLRNWDVATDGMVDLSGKWEFYYDKLLSPEDFSNGSAIEQANYISIPGNFNDKIIDGKRLGGFGYATYHLRVLVNSKDSIYAIKTEFIQTAHKLWANGKVVSEAGKVGRSLKEMQGKIVPMTGVFYNKTGVIDMVLQVSNFYSRAAQVDSIAFGTDSQINDLRNRKTGFDLFLFGCAMIGGLYHFVIFLRRRKDKASLYFSLVCFVVGLRTVLVGERLINHVFDINYTLSGKLLMWTFYMYIPLLVLFIDGLYPGILSKIVVKTSNYIGVIYFVTILLSPEQLYNHLALFAEIAAGVLLLYVLIRLIYRYLIGNEMYLIPSISILILLAARMNDIFYEYSIIQTGSYAPFGVLVFIIMQSYILADKFSKAFGDIEIMSEKLKAVDSLKDDFLANTSQELKTPLNGIIGLLDSLTSGSSGELSKEQHETIKIIKVTSRKLIDLVNDIMDFSRLKNNDIIMEYKSINLRQQAQITMKSLENSLGIKNILLVNNIKSEISPVLADEGRTQQILYNLLENAVKFTNFGTIIISAEEKDDVVEVSIADTGMGISEEKLEHIFERYDSVEKVHTNSTGTGLGLYITKKLVNLMQGEIKVESILDVGSRFTFSLPKYGEYNQFESLSEDNSYEEIVNQSEKEERLHRKIDLSEGSKTDISIKREKTSPIVEYLVDKNGEIKEIKEIDELKLSDQINPAQEEINILLVDDENVNIRIISYFLRTEGYNVHTASNAKEAMDIVSRNNNLDLIILDMMLPDMLGYEICSILRDTYSLIELPVLMMTADRRVESLVVSLECGANDYMHKPVERAELLARVKTLITLKQAVKRALVLQTEVKNSSVAMAVLNENVEENIKRLSEMREYDKLKTEFFANISHELRTPLNVIWGTLQLLESMGSAGVLDDSNLGRYIKVMNQNTLRLVRLINNIIDTTKIDGGYLSLQLTNKDIVFIVEEITLSSAEYIESKGKTLIFDTDVEEKIMAIDEEKLERIILNILSNAIKFTNAGDTIYVNFYDLGDKVRLSIRDTGIGMPEDKLDKIFERFVQVDKSFTRNNEGSGIGLSLVKSLVEMHGGTIHASSKLGEGSEFVVELPVRLLSEDVEIKQSAENLDVQSKYVERIQIEFADIYS